LSASWVRKNKLTAPPGKKKKGKRECSIAVPPNKEKGGRKGISNFNREKKKKGNSLKRHSPGEEKKGHTTYMGGKGDNQANQNEKSPLAQ